MTWTLNLGSAVPAGQKHRRPNVRFECATCGIAVEKYVRPSRPPHRFCSRSCAMKAAMRDPARIEVQRQAASGPRSRNPSAQAGRKRARLMYRADECSVCSSRPAERHHVDGDTTNNAPENIAILCRRCHMRSDGRIEVVREQMRSIQPLGVKARWSR